MQLPELSEIAFLFRIIERAGLAVVFVLISCVLIWMYRKDTSSDLLQGETNGIKVAAALTKPLAATALLLGYVFASLSHPIFLGSPAGAALTKEAEGAVLYFDEPDIVRAFNDLSYREGGLDPIGAVYAQQLVRLSLKIAKLRASGKEKEVDDIISNKTLSLPEIELSISKVGQ